MLGLRGERPRRRRRRVQHVHVRARGDRWTTWIPTGKLQYRHNSIYGNPFLRLLRREVEALVKNKHGKDYLREQEAKTELARVNRDLKRLRTQIASLEERKSKLMADLGR